MSGDDFRSWFEDLQARVPTGQSHKRLACPWGRQFVYHLPRERCALTWSDEPQEG